jgi:hypothetical protein
MDQRHTRGVAGNMPLDFWYQFLSSQSKSNRCRSAGDGIGVLRDLGSAPPNEQSDLRTRLTVDHIAQDPTDRGGPMTFQLPWCLWVGRGILASRSFARLQQCRTIATKNLFSSMPARAGRAAHGRTMTMTCKTAVPQWSGAFFEPPLHRRDGPGSG